MFLFFVFVAFLLLRLNSKLERRLSARRKLHSVVYPLYSYLGLLDHELQNQIRRTQPSDRLVTQAVLDHVTELRALLLQPHSRDLGFWGTASWAFSLHTLLLETEETLEEALQASWEDHEADMKEYVARLNGFIKDTPSLRKLISKGPGLVSQS